MKKRHFIILIVICFYVLPALAQDTTYYDANWRVTVVSNASYFRLKIKRGTGWQVKDCYLSGKSQMEGSYSDDSCKINQGPFSYYDENGHLYHTCIYVNGQLKD
jgi:antitoxin component YwqK of YwqJK toxin-antitoxin module